MSKPTVYQLRAIHLAAPTGFLRRLPGGYWVGNDAPWRAIATAPKEEWVGTQTVMACHARGWMEVAGFRARLTDTGRAFITQEGAR
jgi:hypothetical protein